LRNGGNARFFETNSPAAKVGSSFLFEGLPPLSRVLGGETNGLEIAFVLDRILPIHRVGGAQVWNSNPPALAVSGGALIDLHW